MRCTILGDYKLFYRMTTVPIFLCIFHRNISGPQKMHQILVREGVDTMEKMFRFVAVRYNKKNCLGTRKILAEEDEIQPNGRVFKKVSIIN